MFGKDCVGVIVCTVPLFLRVNEHVRKVLDFDWKPPDVLALTALSGGSMIESAICLTPGMLAAVGTCATYNEISA